MLISECLNELSRFADLDSDPIIVSSSTDFIVNFSQDGDDIRLLIDQNGGRVIEYRGDVQTKYRSYRGLLASAGFGNLKRYVESQKALILREAPYIARPHEYLPTAGDIEVPNDAGGPNLDSRIDSWLRDPSVGQGSTKALVIDGPAGIGKTHLVRHLAFQRAISFGPGSAPPVLHVQSRGRKLTTLNDVIAGTLQAMRVSLRYDQVPVLAKHNLLTIAIDGFDELADPNGYDTAWGSLRDFIEEMGAQGTIILAGRDTFIDAASVKRALPLLATGSTIAAHVRPLSGSEARDWLTSRDWPTTRIAQLESAGLFETGSYALRPFFISQIARYASDSVSFSKFIAFPLRALVESLLERESKILSSVVRDKSEDEIQNLLRLFFREVARDMADAETESIDEASLILISELVFGNHVTSDELGMLRNRVTAFALLEQDLAPGRRRFPHSEIQDYFFGLSIVELVTRGEVSKALKRNILGSDFLETFHDIAASSDPEAVKLFIVKALESSKFGGFDDRVRRNLPALALAALSTTLGSLDEIKLEGYSLDEIVVRGGVPPMRVYKTEISLLDARGADLSNAAFFESQVVSLIGDSTTRLSREFPVPALLSIDEGGRRRDIHDERAKLSWVEMHTQPHEADAQSSSASILFEKLCRVTQRQYWIRELRDDFSGRFLFAPEWPKIKTILLKHNLLSIRTDVAPSGPKSDFVRIHRAPEFLDLANVDPLILEIKRDIAML